MSEVVGPTDINSCIFANTSPMDYNDNVSKLNLIIEVTSEECIDELAQGTLYVRGLCVASNINGATSETFVLDVVGSDNKVWIRIFFTLVYMARKFKLWLFPMH